MAPRTALILIHGIGEQVPMETLTGFVDTVWTSDDTLIAAGKPDPNTGGKRKSNASWSKPDARNRSFELQLVTTESLAGGRKIDFFEYYWAHRVTGTTWEQVRAWILGLMLRNPVTNVPRGVLPAWLVMWVVVLLFVYLSVVAGLAGKDEPISLAGVTFAPAYWTLALAAWIQAWPGWVIAAVWAFIGAASGILLKVMIDVAGDIVRYVDASPKNIAIRQTIRENGVALLETLMGIDADGNPGTTPYDRIVVVGHSLGTIVGYDILTHAFGRHNARIDTANPAGIDQEKRVKLEAMVREAWTAGCQTFDVDAYQALQDECRDELNAGGNPWIVSDFVTIGSPLTHAEFLLAADRPALETAKEKRILPTCPPTLEFDRSTDALHFTYRSSDVRAIGDPHDVAAPRVPHHAALFAYTRWTNIFSPLRGVVTGDIVSGPLGGVLGLNPEGGTAISGIRDIAVLPSSEGTQEDRKRRRLTHLLYWDHKIAKTDGGGGGPFHISALRDVLRLKR